MSQTALALDYLSRDRALYANMLEVLRRGSGEVLSAGEEGVLLYDRACGAHMLSAANPQVAQALLARVPADCDLFVGHEMDYYRQVKDGWHFSGSQICYSAAYLGTEPLPIPDFGGRLVALDRSWAPWVYEHYSHPFGGVAYMEGVIDRGMLGLFLTGVPEPAGFVGFHDEGSIGMLEVLPPYRRRGLGEVLQRAAVNLALGEGRYAFGQVFDDNIYSLALQKKVGMTLSATRMFWLM